MSILDLAKFDPSAEPGNKILLELRSHNLMAVVMGNRDTCNEADLKETMNCHVGCLIQFGYLDGYGDSPLIEQCIDNDMSSLMWEGDVEESIKLGAKKRKYHYTFDHGTALMSSTKGPDSDEVVDDPLFPIMEIRRLNPHVVKNPVSGEAIRTYDDKVYLYEYGIISDLHKVVRCD